MNKSDNKFDLREACAIFYTSKVGGVVISIDIANFLEVFKVGFINVSSILINRFTNYYLKTWRKINYLIDFYDRSWCG